MHQIQMGMSQSYEIFSELHVQLFFLLYTPRHTPEYGNYTEVKLYSHVL